MSIPSRIPRRKSGGGDDKAAGQQPQPPRLPPDAPSGQEPPGTPRYNPQPGKDERRNRSI